VRRGRSFDWRRELAQEDDASFDGADDLAGEIVGMLVGR